MLIRLPARIAFAARLSFAALVPLVLCASAPAAPSDRLSDDFLIGYISSILERDLRWERSTYRLKVINGFATITLYEDDPLRREGADSLLRGIDGLRGVSITVKPTDTGRPNLVGRVLGVTGDVEAFPTGDLFQPLIADPKQPQFFVSLHRFKSPGVSYTMAAVGFGETFGLFRYLGSREGDGLQLSLEGAIFAQFNMSTPSSNLVNADYTIGLPVTYRRGNQSARLRVYHQSSHLGDEFLMSTAAPQRVNLSYEAVDFVYSYEWKEWRVYGGGEYLFHREPEDLKPASTHWGIEYRGRNPMLWKGRLIGGIDMKKLEAHDWAIDTSVKAGLEFGHPNPGQRRVRVLAEWYKGLDPHGQFYLNKVEYFGLGVSLGF